MSKPNVASQLNAMIALGQTEGNLNYRTLAAAFASRDERIERLLGLLRKCEWRGDGHRECPLCWGAEPHGIWGGHSPDCPLKAELEQEQ